MDSSTRHLLGRTGVIVETGTTAVDLTGLEAHTIQILTDTVFANLAENVKTGDAMTGITIPAGSSIHGRFIAVTLTSGAVRIYLTNDSA